MKCFRKLSMAMIFTLMVCVNHPLKAESNRGLIAANIVFASVAVLSVIPIVLGFAPLALNTVQTCPDGVMNFCCNSPSPTQLNETLAPSGCVLKNPNGGCAPNQVVYCQGSSAPAPFARASWAEPVGITFCVVGGVAFALWFGTLCAISGVDVPMM